MEPDEPGHKFVEIIQIWKYNFSICPVAVIVYDSTRGKTVQFNSWRLCMLISVPNKRIFASHVVGIEVQLGYKISGSNTDFRVVTTEGNIVKITKTQDEGNNRNTLVLYGKLG